MNDFTSKIDTPSGATLSVDAKKRYRLWRIWDKHKPCVLFIMLNPSTANALDNDKTVVRCANFAKDWGFGGMMIGNLYAIRTSKPEELFKCQGLEEPDPENDLNIETMKEQCQTIVYAWGVHGRQFDAGDNFILKNPGGFYIDKTNTGIPKHPLFIKGDEKLKPWA